MKRYTPTDPANAQRIVVDTAEAIALVRATRDVENDPAAQALIARLQAADATTPAP